MNENKKQVGTSTESVEYELGNKIVMDDIIQRERKFKSMSEVVEDQRKSQLAREYELERARAWVMFYSANVQAEVTAVANDCNFKEKSVSKRADLMLEEFDERFKEALTK